MGTISTTAALRCAVLRVAIDIETPIVFLYQRSRGGNRPLRFDYHSTNLRIVDFQRLDHVKAHHCIDEMSFSAKLYK